ncbi:MAG TPA: LapA family protein [Azospirillum sp.]|nr:LapA family protein [Azospirillum sp.]
MRYLTWIITLPIALAAVLFAISNREAVTLSLWPLPFTVEAPVYLATLIALLVGFIAGGVITWMGQGRHRRRARAQSDRAYTLERELKETQARAAAAEKRIAELTRPAAGQPRVPALPSSEAA